MGMGWSSKLGNRTKRQRNSVQVNDEISSTNQDQPKRQQSPTSIDRQADDEGCDVGMTSRLWMVSPAWTKTEDFKRPSSKNTPRTVSSLSTPREPSYRPTTAPGILQTLTNHGEADEPTSNSISSNLEQERNTPEKKNEKLQSHKASKTPLKMPKKKIVFRKTKNNRYGLLKPLLYKPRVKTKMEKQKEVSNTKVLLEALKARPKHITFNKKIQVCVRSPDKTVSSQEISSDDYEVRKSTLSILNCALFPISPQSRHRNRRKRSPYEAPVSGNHRMRYYGFRRLSTASINSMVDRLHESKTTTVNRKLSFQNNQALKLRNHQTMHSINQTVSRLRSFRDRNLSLVDDVQRLTVELERTKQALEDINRMIMNGARHQKISQRSSYNRKAICAITMGGKSTPTNRNFHPQFVKKNMEIEDRSDRKYLTSSQLQDLIERLTKSKLQSRACHSKCNETIFTRPTYTKFNFQKIEALSFDRNESTENTVASTRKRNTNNISVCRKSSIPLRNWETSLRNRKSDQEIMPRAKQRTLTSTEQFQLIEKLTRGASEKAPDSRRVPTEAEKKFGIVCSLMWTGY